MANLTKTDKAAHVGSLLRCTGNSRLYVCTEVCANGQFIQVAAVGAVLVTGGYRWQYDNKPGAPTVKYLRHSAQGYYYSGAFTGYHTHYVVKPCAALHKWLTANSRVYKRVAS